MKSIGKDIKELKLANRSVLEKYEKSTRKVREYYVNICLSVLAARSIRINEDSLVVSEFVRGLRYGSSRSVRRELRRGSDVCQTYENPCSMRYEVYAL